MQACVRSVFRQCSAACGLVRALDRQPQASRSYCMSACLPQGGYYALRLFRGCAPCTCAHMCAHSRQSYSAMCLQRRHAPWPCMRDGRLGCMRVRGGAATCCTSMMRCAGTGTCPGQQRFVTAKHASRATVSGQALTCDWNIWPQRLKAARAKPGF